MTQDYSKPYHTYPVYSAPSQFEGSMVRYSPFPNPQDIYNYALFGMPKQSPFTNEVIPIEFAEDALKSAISEMEMKLGISLSENTYYHSEDYMEDMFATNYAGMRLERWPATKVVAVKSKYPHTNTANPYLSYTIPANWIFLRNNKVNIVPSSGTVSPITDNSGNAGYGFFSFLTGYRRGPWAPGSIEVVYTAGYEQDKLPSVVADLIKTWASIRLVNDILPFLFPNSSVTNSIDGVSQTVGLTIQSLIAGRIQALEKKKAEQISAIEGSYGRQIKMVVLGS